MKFNFFSFIYSDLCRSVELRKGVKVKKFQPSILLGIFSPRFTPVLLCRLAYFFYLIHLGFVAKTIALINFFLFGIEIGIKCHIGRGLFFPHTSGIVIGALSIGENAIIYQGVTIGARDLDFAYLESSRPVIGDYVTIATGAVILGAIKVGDRARIGVNSVVLDSIPSDALAVGAPAKVIERHISMSL